MRQKNIFDMLFPDTENHKKVIPGLSRIIGQIEGIKRMVENNRPAEEILIQIKSARKGLKSLENTVFNTHLEYCLYAAVQDKANAVQQIEKISKLFDQASE